MSCLQLRLTNSGWSHEQPVEKFPWYTFSAVQADSGGFLLYAKAPRRAETAAAAVRLDAFEAAQRWKRPVVWTAAMGQFAILFEDRFAATARRPGPAKRKRSSSALHRHSDIPHRDDHRQDRPQLGIVVAPRATRRDREPRPREGFERERGGRGQRSRRSRPHRFDASRPGHPIQAAFPTWLRRPSGRAMPPSISSSIRSAIRWAASRSCSSVQSAA